jgi:ribose transport system substrate-binding protein
MKSFGKYRLGSVVALAATVTLLAACGSSTETSGSDASASLSPATPAVPSSSPSDSSGALADCISTASASADAGTAAVPLKAPSTTADSAALEGKKISLVIVIDNPFIRAVADGFQAGAKALGMEPSVFDAKAQVPLMNQGVEQAVTQGASGIALLAIPAALVEKPLADAVKAGITVVDNFNGSPSAPLPEGVTAHVTADFIRSGAMMVDWILKDSQCTANVGVLFSQNIPAAIDLRDGAVAELEKLCPTCESSVVEFDTGNVATDLPQKVQTMLTANPNMNYIFVFNDSSVPFIDSALAQAGRSDVKIVSHDGVQENLDAMKAGTTSQVLNVAFPPNEWVGWALVDQLARGILGEPAPDWTIPVRLVDASNIAEEQLFPEYTGFEDVFKSGWSGP